MSPDPAPAPSAPDPVPAPSAVFPTVALPSVGAVLPALGLGTYKLTGAAGQAAIEQGLALGYRHLDTAQAYGNEAEVGAALRASGLHRDDVVVTTKLTADAFASAAHVRAAVETSLERLGLDRIDLVLLHWPNPWRTAAEGTYRDAAAALADLAREHNGATPGGTAPDAGSVRWWGVSNFLPQHLDALAADGLQAAVNQIQVDPLIQQRAVQEATTQHGAAVVAYTPLGRGGDVFAHPAVRQVAQEQGVSTAQAVLAWHRAAGRASIPRSGAAAHLAENLASLRIELTEEQIAALDAADTGAPARQDPRTFGL